MDLASSRFMWIFLILFFLVTLKSYHSDSIHMYDITSTNTVLSGISLHTTQNCLMPNSAITLHVANISIGSFSKCVKVWFLATVAETIRLWIPDVGRSEFDWNNPEAKSTLIGVEFAVDQSIDK